MGKKDLDEVLRGWDYLPGEVQARLVQAEDGRDVLQVRVDLGVLQLEIENRPDGQRPGGAESYYDYLKQLAWESEDGFVLDEEKANEVDREFLQYYQRRVCWLALRNFDRAIEDADHNLALLDFVKDCAPSEEWFLAHEQYRPFILFHRTQAAALYAMESDNSEQAISALNSGIERIEHAFDEYELEDAEEENEMVRRLKWLRESVRDRYEIGKTLEEELSDAIKAEEYELAAEIRDKIANRTEEEVLDPFDEDLDAF
jgi:hypothetical protein